MVPCGQPFAKKGPPMRSVLDFSESPFIPLHRLVVLRLSEWISYILTVVPPRSPRSLPEIICGCLISPKGWVTCALNTISLRSH